MADGSVVIDTKLDSSGLKKGLAALGKASLAGLGAAAGAVGSLTTAAIAVGKEFEHSTAKASTLFGDVAVDVDNLDQKILDLSGKTGLAASDIGNSLYNALSAGIPATEDMSDAMAYMEKNAKLATAGFTDIDTAVTATAKVLNAYGMDVAETDKVHKILMQTQNKGITTVGELGSVLAQVTPTAAAMGFSFEQVGASLATMTAQGTPTAQATTQLNSLLAELGKSGTKANQSLMKATEGTKYAGKSFQEILKSGAPMSEILGLISAEADESGLSMLDMFSSIEAGKAALSLFSEEGEKFNENLKAMGTEADVVGDAYEKMMDTFDAQKDIFVESAKNLGISVYKGLQEPLKNAAKYGTESLKKLNDAFSKGGLKGLVGSLGSVGADIVNKVIGFAPDILDAATDLVTSFAEGLEAAAPEIADSVVSLSEQLLSSLGDISVTLIELATDVIVELANSIAEDSDGIVETITGTMTDLISAITENLPQIFEAVVGMIPTLASSLVEALPQITETILGEIPNLINSLMESLPEIISGVSELVVGLVEALPEILTVIVDALPGLIESILGGLAENLPLIINAVVEIMNALVEAMPVIIEILIAVLPQLVESISSALVPLFPIIVDAGVKLFTSLVQNMPTIISMICSQLPQIITSSVNVLAALTPQLIMCGVQLFVALIRNMPQIIATIVSALPQIIRAIYDGIVSGVGQMASAGLNLIKGLWQGMSNAAGWLWGQVKGMLKGLTGKIKSFFGIQSPSKLFQHEIGDMLMLGLAKGIQEEAGAAVKETEEAAQKVAGVDFSIKPEVDKPDFSAMVASMKGTVTDDNIQSSAFIAGTVANSSTESANDNDEKSESDKDDKPKYVQNDIYIDGKRTARVLTPYVSKELEWEDK